MYRLLFRLLFTKLDPELAHQLGAFFMKSLLLFGLIRPPRNPAKHVVFGLNFQNALGMAAGFDKNAKLVRPLFALGFGHVEIGTVTALAQSGNPKPRLFRLVDHRALINRMGFNNDGAEVISKRLQKLRNSKKPLPIIGVNIGKSRAVELQNAADDYETSARLLASFADYVVVNVSSPNTPGLRDLQNIENLRPILKAVKLHTSEKPLLVKIAPDLADEDVIEIAELVKELKLAGVVAVNTTLSRKQVAGSKFAEETGGLSGPMLAERAIEVLKLLREHLPSECAIISVGGVQTPEDYRRRLELGANLVQGYTAFVYEGPGWPKRLTKPA